MGGNSWARWAIGGLVFGAVVAASHYDGQDWIQPIVTAGMGAVFGLLAMVARDWMSSSRREVQGAAPGAQ
jgi:hypothetical protein